MQTPDFAQGFSVDRDWIRRTLGPEWEDAWEFFGRMVTHLSLEAAPTGEIPKDGAQELRESIRALIPSSVEEMTPFAVRQVWNGGLKGAARTDLLTRLQGIAALTGATWGVDELAARVDEIYG